MNTPMYDKTSPQSILEFAFPLTGRCLRDFLSLEEQKALIENANNKGDLGNMIEKYYFDINPGNSPDPDFPEAGIELKTAAVVPKRAKKNTLVSDAATDYRAKERLKLSKINYGKLANESWEGNTLFKKCQNILLLLSLYESGVLMIDRRFVAQPIMWSLSEKDIEFIKNDWTVILEKILAGRAHELSGSDTMYLEACTSGKGRLLSQPMSDIKAKERSFAFKASFVTNSIMADAKFVSTLEPIVKNNESPAKFQDIVVSRVKKFEGAPITEIAKALHTDISGAKHYLALLSYKMLGIKSKNAEEFIKAGIEIKAIKFEADGRLVQDVSFPAFSYMDIVDEEWEDSTFKQKIDTKMFFMMFRNDENGITRFVRGYFWSMPKVDITEAKRVWQETKRRVAEGRADDLPLKGFSKVAHVRNHARDSKPENMAPSPKNGYLPVRGFWLNNSYIRKQLEDVIGRHL